MNDIGVVELAHDAGLTQKVSPLFFCVARLEGFYGHKHLPFAWKLQVATAHLSKLTCEKVLWENAMNILYIHLKSEIN